MVKEGHEVGLWEKRQDFDWRRYPVVKGPNWIQ